MLKQRCGNVASWRRHHVRWGALSPTNRVSAAFTCAAGRRYPGKSADEVMEEMQELYATAKDEFEIAHDSTSHNTVYAATDRAAAKDELAKLKDAFAKATADEAGEIGREVRRRVGGRLRELERAVEGMEEGARGG